MNRHAIKPKYLGLPGMLLLTAMLLALAGVGGGMALAAGSGCDVTIEPADIVATPSAIQDAVDAAGSGDNICLKGTFSGASEVATVEIGTSKITIRAGSTAIIDGGTGPALRVLGGVEKVTIERLEIKNRTGFRGGGIEAADGSTSRITVRDNFLHDNEYSGILVFSEGDFMHSRWDVRGNVVTDNGSIGIELTNAEKSKIRDNYIRGHGTAGIVVQARNTTSDAVSPIVKDVQVKNNDVSDTTGSAGIYVISFESVLTGPPFPPSVGFTAQLRKVKVENNHVHHNAVEGIRLLASNPGATADKNTIKKNTLVANAEQGVLLSDFGSGGTVADNTVESNSATDNGGDGFAADTGVGVNKFKKNRSNANGGFGYSDAAPSVNTYAMNQCDYNAAGASTPGLCSP